MKLCYHLMDEGKKTMELECYGVSSVLLYTGAKMFAERCVGWVFT